uniref:Interferon-induced protein 44-like n=1 Tax=Cyprinodon variegatus TaxID=28743 RepID=A0A3Q2D4L6_CYPVA
MSTLKSELSRDQQRTICSQLGSVKLKLLYKATVHGFTGAAFHQRCDNQSPTVSVGYNASGYVFGGYTSQPFSQSGQYVNDDQAFLFGFTGGKLHKYPVTSAPHAVKMIGNSGPYFGDSLALVNGSKPVIYSNTGAQIYSEQVADVKWLKHLSYLMFLYRNKKKLMESIQTYKPTVSYVSQARVLLIGPVGAGKSSFFNSINSVFRGHVTSQAISGCSSTSLTTQFRTYSLKAGREGKPLPIVLCDTMGLEDSKEAGIDIDDIGSIFKGHMPDRYQFNPAAPLPDDAHGYRKSPGIKDKIHCVAYVIDACKVSIMPTKLEEKLEAIRKKANLLGIPQLVLLTKVDEACPLVKEDLRNIYRSGYIKEIVRILVGVPLSCIVPVKSYSEELELDLNCDILLLSAVIQMLRFVDNYFDELSDQLSSVELKNLRSV